MSKSNQKRHNLLVVETLSKKHGFSKRFINQCLNGERQSVTAKTIVKEYSDLDKKISELLEA